MRLQQFPKGLGKGFDAALIGAWLLEVVKPMNSGDVPATHPKPKPKSAATKASCREIFKVIQWGLYNTNAFFRLLYNGRIWLTKEEGLQAASYGWGMLVPLLQLGCQSFVVLLGPQPRRRMGRALV